MKIRIVGPAYPYRGGIASFDEMLARTFASRGDDVRIDTFTLQYPSLLFPGRTQYSESPPPEDIYIERRVNSMNPFNWLAVGRALRREAPDMVIMKYWTPFLAPCLGTIARAARRGGRTKVVVQVDNIVPHEHHFFDKAFNRYFVNSVDGFVYMSGQVGEELAAIEKRGKPSLFSPHPIFTGYGERIGREEACRRLGLDPSLRYALFFGLVRQYKGLDLLLDAWKIFKRSGGGKDYRLIVAGEFYDDKRRYDEQIERNGLRDDVIVHDRFIPDGQVREYFSAADVLVQPYHTATQSGVTQIAYNFEMPMIVTRVGGLAEIVPDGVAGFVTDVSAESVAQALEKFRSGDTAARLAANMPEQKKRFSWDTMADAILEAWRMAGGTPHPEK